MHTNAFDRVYEAYTQGWAPVMRRTFSIWFFLVICTIKSILPLNSTFSWEELLQQAAEEVRRGRYEQGLEKLRIADETGEPRDFRYYWVLGKAQLGQGSELDALRNFRYSLQLQPDQQPLLREMTELYDRLRLPDKALETARVILSKQPDDAELRYRAMIWASRTGNLEYYKNALRELEVSNPYASDERALLDEIRILQSAKKDDDVITRCRKFLPFFPKNKDLHRTCILSYRNKAPKLFEEGLIQRAVIFRDDPVFQHILSMEYLDQKRYADSCALARRALLLALQQSQFPEKDYLVPIRRIYLQNGSVSDLLAMDLLEDVLLKKKKLSGSEWETLLKQTRFNWEILSFAISEINKSERTDESDKAVSDLRQRYLSLRGPEREKDLSRFAGPYYLDSSFESFLENASVGE
ncbi:hypothetical protein LEP1GSC050_2070 [Leptospira broomii serovar Hurstbridge str. 5399]|uniref:Uncharacterized protein n=2 Tax=Leptospira broomii TaxID=301541 RepID=T0FD92_9LEPT|nr:hypothetical protein LEP1GSC050_2070 [Leptospira broomii serovar Hurstbridge str. 5399]